MGGGVEGVDCVVGWLLSLRLPARRRLGPRTSVVIRELVDVDDNLTAVDCEGLRAAGGRATRKPVGLRTRLAVAWVSSFNVSFLRFDMRGRWKETRVHQDSKD